MSSTGSASGGSFVGSPCQGPVSLAERGGLSDPVAEEVELRASGDTVADHLDLLDPRRVHHEGTLHAETQIIKRGRAVVFLESRVTDDAGKLVATASGSFAVIRRNER